MKKIQVTAICAIILLIASASNDFFVSTIAGVLLTPYMIVGLIMAIAAGFFGVYFGRRGGKSLYAIVSAFCALTSISGILGGIVDFDTVTSEKNIMQHLSIAWQSIVGFVWTWRIVILIVISLIVVTVLVGFIFKLIKRNKGINSATTSTDICLLEKQAKPTAISNENGTTNIKPIDSKIMSSQKYATSTSKAPTLKINARTSTIVNYKDAMTALSIESARGNYLVAKLFP